MDAGEIIIDVSGEEKAHLTVPRLLEMFADIRREAFGNDEMLLTGGQNLGH
jgi:putative ABC transport system ATP-binding protein